MYLHACGPHAEEQRVRSFCGKLKNSNG